MQPLDDIWRSHSQAAREIAARGMASYVARFPDSRSAFRRKNHDVGCMDERIKGVGVRAAGSGVLMTDEEQYDFFRASGAQGITSHAGCGAVALYAAQYGIRGDLDELAQRSAREIAAKYRLNYLGHLPVEPAFHVARAIYYDGTGAFDWSAEGALFPPGFTIGRKFFSQWYALREARIAIDIAFGDRGFGRRFTSAEPLIIVPVATTLPQLNDLEAELRGLDTNHGERILVSGFETSE